MTTRKSKIARLPDSIREQINHRLQNGETAKQILEWLNALPETNALLKADFGGQPVSEPNLTHWRHGGYREWQSRQDALEALRRLGPETAQFASEADAGRLSDQLAVVLAARLAVAMRHTPSMTGIGDPEGEVGRLRELCAVLVPLRKGDHNAIKLSLERQKMERRRQCNRMA
jgi:hypothetical protein